MADLILPTFTLACFDTSLGAGRLSADWVPTLQREARTFPECKGDIVIYNLGHGGWTSNDLLAGTPLLVSLQPSHIFTEGGAINDCFDTGGGPAISRATHNANNAAMLTQMLAGIPGVDITMMTMSSVSSYQTARTALGDFNDDELLTAGAFGVRALNLYRGTALTPGGWPKPLNGDLTNGGIPFVVPVTAGYSGQIGATTWDPAKTAPQFGLSADELTATRTILSSGTSVLATAPMTSGLIHVEFQMLLGTTADYFGLANSAFPFATADLSTDPNGIGCDNTGNIVVNGTTVGHTAFTYGPGDIVAIEVDVSARLAYFMKGSSRSAGIDISGLGAPLFAATAGSHVGSGALLHATTQGDGLHPVFKSAVDTYSYPNWKALLRQLMAAFWP